MIISGSELALGETEDRIRAWLSAVTVPDESVQYACAHFGRIASAVFRLAPGNRKGRYWCVDDLVCETLRRKDEVMTLEGGSWWLSGGDLCDRFRLDVALDANPLLYSYKFLNSATGSQILYVGKRPDGWLLNGE